jgi:phosphosulfolactate synthase (CoM biosynthesis protein A)
LLILRGSAVLERICPYTDIRDVLSLCQQYVDIFIFAWAYMRRWEHEEVDHEIGVDGGLHPGTKVKHGAGVKLL